MRHWLIATLACVTLAACNPAQTTTAQQQGPDAVITAMYASASQKIAHNQTNDVDDVPMSESLAHDFKAASDKADANDEPFIDGDLVFDCQDCGEISAVAVTVTTPPADGKAVVEAHFSVLGQADVVIWDMIDSPQGWRVDNIRSPDGYDLRKAITEQMSEQAASCTEERGADAAAALVAQCTQVSPATHPPCNAANSCAMIQAEVMRGCGLLTGHKPAFCTAAPAATP